MFITKVQIPKVSLRGCNSSTSETLVESIVPAYTLTCAEKSFTWGVSYSISVLRDIAPNKQTQIEVICTGGLVSPVFLVDEGASYDFWNQVIEVTPTASTCKIILKCTINGIEYNVGKYTMNNVYENNTTI